MLLKGDHGCFGEEEDVSRGVRAEDVTFVFKVKAVSGEKTGNGGLLF